ncbi:zinc-binding protein A33-like [Chiloscyllium plagiosum]|uniref:zinc-binding protein A33-like n=1 Tax=Chiloscyllium plagiosum TaxID=36176 RepID=UPI001CB88914|nr:zinc-binding protein A33-like [Chiloscyllium plagiosum]
MALAWAHVSFTEELQCPICLEVFTDPVILPCGHNFCRRCVQECWQRQAPGLWWCPECREAMGQEGPLRRNQVVQEMSEEARSLAGLYCQQHGLRYKLFCDTDLQLICVSCRDSPKHQQHQASPVQEAAQFYKVKLQEVITSLQDQASTFTAFLSVEEDKISTVKKNAESLRVHVREQFEQMHSFLREREAGLTRELAEHEASALRLIRENLQTVQLGLSSLSAQLAELTEQQAQGDDVEFLKEVSQQRPHDIPLPAKASTDLPLGIFKGPLQYKVWKEMKDFINPVPEALTLDRGSAHQRLLVSEDLTHVRLTDSNQQPQGPERFGPCVNILAAQGFQSGRHYWEVEVGTKTAWDLGVARETVRRKGRITLSPVDGYWTLWLRDGDQYKALDWPAVPLAPSAQPRKVGVYLDFEGGQVSFYNADDMSHLYTFRDTFRERLFPYFSPYLTSCPGNAEGIRLCTPKL